MSVPQPPKINTQDLSDSDDHFSSASEGSTNFVPSGGSHSPIPQTRVERVDDKPAHGEIPGTPAYEKRLRDAVPDEIEVIPPGQRSRALSVVSQNSRPQTPSGTIIPKTVVERVDDEPAHGEVEGTLAKELRAADAEPDEVRRAPPEARDGRPQGRIGGSLDPSDQQAWFRNMWEGGQAAQTGGDEGITQNVADEEADDADDLGDEFDEFAEEGDEDDFGDFDVAPDVSIAPTQPSQPQISKPDILADLPLLDVMELDRDNAEDVFQPYLDAMFPDLGSPNNDHSTIEPVPTSAFLSDRSLSLWEQLVQPPPMQPPNWTRSRIRRLFLVSLGVPVDLDEILPPSKQKRLILPNINLTSGSPTRSSTLERLKEDSAANASSTSIDSKGIPKRLKAGRNANKGPPLPPNFDSNAATLLCSTTEEAMYGYTDLELREHVFTLESLNKKASSVLEYWLQRKDDSLKEKEALEGVIENLVGFVKGRRGK